MAQQENNNNLQEHKDNIIKLLIKIEDYSRRELKQSLRYFGGIESSGNVDQLQLRLAQKLATQEGKVTCQ